jgi:sugar phosphate isomerase/epimerase
MNARKGAEVHVMDTLRRAVRANSSRYVLASAILDDLAAAGFTVVESWQLDRDVLAEGFRQGGVELGMLGPFELWTEPSEAETYRMADVLRRNVLGSCPTCKGTGSIPPASRAEPCEPCHGTGVLS